MVSMECSLASLPTDTDRWLDVLGLLGGLFHSQPLLERPLWTVVQALAPAAHSDRTNWYWQHTVCSSARLSRQCTALDTLLPPALAQPRLRDPSAAALEECSTASASSSCKCAATLQAASRNA